MTPCWAQGPDDLDRGKVAVDVVEVGLGVVLDDKDRRFRPVLVGPLA